MQVRVNPKWCSTARVMDLFDVIRTHLSADSDRGQMESLDLRVDKIASCVAMLLDCLVAKGQLPLQTAIDIAGIYDDVVEVE